MMECIYYLWFLILNIKLKRDYYNDYYENLTEIAFFHIEELRKKGFHPTEIMYRNVIEMLGYYGKADKVL